MVNTNSLRIIYGDGSLGFKGNNFHYIFNYHRGGLESLVINNKEWPYREPRPTFWRATTDNDRGSNFPKKSLQWLGADQFIDIAHIALKVNGKSIPVPFPPQNNSFSNQEWIQNSEIIFTYQTLTLPTTQVSIAYQIFAEGQIKVNVHYYGKAGLPELPVFDIRFILPTPALWYEYDGLSGETYPDRMAGAKRGTYHVEGLPVTTYLVPQDCGVHMQTTRLTIARNSVHDNSQQSYLSPFYLSFTNKTNPFAFSCLTYTAEELENATHQEELPPVHHTVLNILGAVRGVGGIDSWGSEVESPYRISAAQDLQFSFQIMNSTD